MRQLLKILSSYIAMLLIISPSYALDLEKDSESLEEIEGSEEDLHQTWLDASLAWLNLAAGKQWKAPTDCTLPFDTLLAQDENNILVDCQLLKSTKSQIETQAVLIVLTAQNVDDQRSFYQKPRAIEQIAGVAAQLVASDPDRQLTGIGNAFRETEYKRPRNDDINHVVARSLHWMQESGACTGALFAFLEHVQNDDNIEVGNFVRIWSKNIRLEFGSALYNPDNSCL